MTRQQQRGLGIVSAIFLLVALTALGAYMLTLSGVTQTTVDRALLTVRVYSAARSGLEWGIHRAVAPATQPGVCDPLVTTTFTPTGSGFTAAIPVTVTCRLSTQIQSNANPAYIYYIISTAAYSSPGTLDHIERKFDVTVCRTASTDGDC